MNGFVLVFSGPSGVGKSTLINFLLEKFQSAGLTVSHTTRQPRPAEQNGKDYHFVTHDEFDHMIANGEFVEYAACYGNRYGTSRQAIDDVLKSKDICILDLEFEGAYNMLEKQKINHRCVGVLVLPPSINALSQRLRDRNTETDESLSKRLSDSFTANKIAKYRYVIINLSLENSKQQLSEIVERELES